MSPLCYAWTHAKDNSVYSLGKEEIEQILRERGGYIMDEYKPSLVKEREKERERGELLL